MASEERKTREIISQLLIKNVIIEFNNLLSEFLEWGVIIYTHAKYCPHTSVKLLSQRFGRCTC